MNLQPSLVYAVLALSTFLKSSTLEDGEAARQKARTYGFRFSLTLAPIPDELISVIHSVPPHLGSDEPGTEH